MGEDLGSHGDTIMEFPLETLGPEQELTRVTLLGDLGPQSGAHQDHPWYGPKDKCRIGQIRTNDDDNQDIGDEKIFFDYVPSSAASLAFSGTNQTPS